MSTSQRPTTTSLKKIIGALAAACVLAATAIVADGHIAHATEAGPGGANVGFDFTWNDAANPAGHSASFLETDGVTANNCAGGAMTASTKTCNFVFDYRVNGAVQAATTHAARWVTWSNPTSYTDGKPVATGCSSPTSGAGDLGKAPLTLFDCFNTGSFGQVIRPTATGQLTQFRMSMTCLRPSGTSPYELYALLYELTPEGTAIASPTPLATNLVNLSTCPTASTWRNKTFKSSDFAWVTFNFGNPAVTAGKFYGVYLTGAGVPGTVPPGANPAMAAAKAASTTTTAAPTTTTPWSRFKSEKNKTAATTPTTAASSRGDALAVGTNKPTLVDVPAQMVVGSALRLMAAGNEKTFMIQATTPSVCQGAGRNLVIIKKGRCGARIVLRSNGTLAATVRTAAIEGTPTTTGDVVAVETPATLYFSGGTALMKATSKRQIATLAKSARVSNAVLVLGYTGNSQGESANLVKLSTTRAAATRSLLRGAGVTQTIAIHGFGAKFPVTNAKSNKAQDKNRRTVVYIIP